jgi:hypothetical protein
MSQDKVSETAILNSSPAKNRDILASMEEKPLEMAFKGAKFFSGLENISDIYSPVIMRETFCDLLTRIRFCPISGTKP